MSEQIENKEEVVVKKSKKGFFGRKADSLYESGKKVVGAKQIKNNWDFIKANGETILDDLRALREGKKEEKELTIEELKEQHNLSPYELAIMYKNNGILFYLSLLMFVLVIVVAFYQMINAKYLASVACFFIGFMVFIFAVNFSFKNFFLKNFNSGKLVNFNDWMKEGSFFTDFDIHQNR